MRRVGPALAIGLALPAAALADELPMRKAGLWEMKMAMAAPMPAMSMQQCTDETTDKSMSTMFGPMQKSACPHTDIRKTASGWSVDSTCGFSGATVTSHLDITGDFQSGYVVKVTSSHAGGDASSPAAASGNASFTVEAKWLGSCKPDQKPGDIVMPGGLKVNIKELESLRGLTKQQ